MDNIVVWPLSVANEALLTFHLIVVTMFVKACVKDHGRKLQPITRKGLISVYGSALVSSFVNIFVFFDKLANNF